MGSRKISEAAAATFDTRVWVGQTFAALRNLLLIRTIKSYHTRLTLRVIFYEPPFQVRKVFIKNEKNWLSRERFVKDNDNGLIIIKFKSQIVGVLREFEVR